MKQKQPVRVQPLGRNFIIKYLSKVICLGLFVLISKARSALNPLYKDAETVKVGPDQWSSLVVY